MRINKRSLVHQMERGKIVLSPHRATWLVHDRIGGRWESNRTSVCIMGAGCEYYPLYPEEELDFELWGCNGLFHLGFDNQHRFRADRWFELHPYEPQSELDLQRLLVSPVDVYTLEEDPSYWVPRFIRFPLDRIERLGFRMTFASTFAYQMALAIENKFKVIRLVGIFMVAGRELIVERGNLLYWIGLAEGLGIDVQLYNCDDCLIQHPYKYGYDYYQEKDYVEGLCRDVLSSIARDGYRGSR